MKDEGVDLDRVGSGRGRGMQEDGREDPKLVAAVAYSSGVARRPRVAVFFAVLVLGF